jgi:hypothetical protein
MATRMCDVCGIRPAVVAVRRTVPGEGQTVQYLCELHAAEARGGRSSLGSSPLGGGSLFDDFFDRFFDQGRPGVGETTARRQAEQVDVTQFFSAATTELLERAAQQAVEWGNLDLTGEHLLYAALEDTVVRRVLEGAGADPDAQILFIDELHTVVGAGAAEGSMDASNMLKPALARGELRVVGATTIDEYRKNIEKDAPLERRFQPVLVSEPTGRYGGDPARPQESLRGAPQGQDHGGGHRRHGRALRSLHHRTLLARQSHRPRGPGGSKGKATLQDQAQGHQGARGAGQAPEAGEGSGGVRRGLREGTRAQDQGG